MNGLKMDAGKVSVIMNCRNSAKYLREAIDSVFAQTFENWEIIFFDNASTDDSPAIAKSYDARIRYFRSAQPLSLGAARNRALSLARGEFIAFLDCDDVWFPAKLEAQVAAFRSNRDLGFVFSNFLMRFEATGEEVPAGSVNDERGNLFRSNLASYKVGILTVMLRSSLFKQLDDWFDPGLTLVEDIDLFLRLLHRTEAYYDGRTLATYRIHGSNLTHILRDGWADEHKYLLEKLRRVVPHFEATYSAEVRKYLENGVSAQVRSKMEEGKRSEAHRISARFKYSSPRLAALYLLTLLPPATWKRVYRLYFRLRYHA